MRTLLGQERTTKKALLAAGAKEWTKKKKKGDDPLWRRTRDGGAEWRIFLFFFCPLDVMEEKEKEEELSCMKSRKGRSIHVGSCRCYFWQWTKEGRERVGHGLKCYMNRAVAEIVGAVLDVEQDAHIWTKVMHWLNSLHAYDMTQTSHIYII